MKITIQTPDNFVRLLQLDEQGDRNLWESLIDSSSDPDVYYRPAYLQAYEAAGHGHAAALLVDTGQGRALIPLLFRPVSKLDNPSDIYALDGITAYGYGGLLLLDGLTELGESQARSLFEHICSWSRQAGLVSLLIRLHPMLKQEEWLQPAMGGVCTLRKSGQTMALRTSQWSEAAMSICTLAKGRRCDLRVARRTLQVTWASQRPSRDDDLQIFLDLYENRMDQVNASSFYHFSPAYYDVLSRGLNDRFDIAISWLEDKPVGASIFMADRKFAHYHLSATNELGRTNKAATFLINEAVNWARKRGCEYLHLGGGTKGEDGLFAFKKSFGGELFQYSFVTIIADMECYQNLVQERLANPHIVPLDMGFFPQYRG
jgi:hypothetical protein